AQVAAPVPDRDLLGAGRVLDANAGCSGGVEVGLVHRVVQGVALHRVAQLVDGDLAPAAVAYEVDEPGAAAGRGHLLLVGRSRVPRRDRRPQRGAVSRGLDEEAIAVAGVGEPVAVGSLRRTPPGLLLICVEG